jgi:hypothetical protein
VGSWIGVDSIEGQEGKNFLIFKENHISRDTNFMSICIITHKPFMRIIVS